MKETKFQRADGTEGTSYKLEPGDKVTSRFEQPKKQEGGKFENWSLGVTYQGKEIFLTLTKAQADKLNKIGHLQQKNIEAYEYENQYGKQIGIKVT